MKSAAYASFCSAAEIPDRDDEVDELPPAPTCEACNLTLGQAPVGSYVDCEECGACSLSRWPEPPDEPTEVEEWVRMRTYNHACLMADIAEYVTTDNVAALASLARHFAERTFALEKMREKTMEAESPPCF